MALDPKRRGEAARIILDATPGVDFKYSTQSLSFEEWNLPDPIPSDADMEAALIAFDADKAAKSQALANAKAEINSGPPAQSVPALVTRVEAIEEILRQAGML